MKQNQAHVPGESPTPARFRLKLPLFVSANEVGLGDALKHVSATAGIRPCAGCERRAAALNSWVSFRSRKSS
jgi:hypothetical protein